MGSHRSPWRSRFAAACALAFTSAAPPADAQPPPRLAPSAPPVEVIDDPSQPVSGSAITGLVLLQPDDTIGHDRLWAYLSPPVPKTLELAISSIDGRYYAEVPYQPAGTEAGWVALDLGLRGFAVVEDKSKYVNPTSEVAVLLRDAQGARIFPVRWGSAHDPVGKQPPPPTDADAIRVYVNTERASAFLDAGGKPSYCRDASSMSGFKFNAVCDGALGDFRDAELQDGKHVVSSIPVFRRSGVRTLAPLAVEVQIKY